MAFDPLGKFDPAAPLTPAVLGAAATFAEVLMGKYLCPPGSLRRIYTHWTVGHYEQDFNDYNGALRYAYGHFYYDVCGDPRDNASGDPDREHGHTYMRNGHAFGFATDDMAFANEHDFGPEPITLATADWLCGGVAAVALAYAIDLSVPVGAPGPYAGEHASYTHAEAANHPGTPAQYDNYYVTGERWDWCTMVPLPAGMSNADINPSIMGDALRKREHAYKVTLMMDANLQAARARLGIR